MYRATIENRGDTRYHATARHGAFEMDTHGKASSPIDAALAGLCACVGHYVRDFLVDRGLPAGGFRVSAEAATTADRSRLGPIALRIDPGAARLDAEQERALLAVIERCPLHGTFRQACAIDAALVREDAGVARGAA
jgi:uncharacterized OsmC-like protein